VITATPDHDSQLRERLEALTNGKSDFWSFKHNSRREHGHGLFQYPAMTVPQLARVVLKEICEVHPEVQWVADPYSGSGTILTESMNRGLNFMGIDINPLAILLCRAKAGPFFIEALQKRIKEVKSAIEADKGHNVEVNFPNRDKWFRGDVQIALSRIKRAITRERAIWTRRFLWIALAETIRLTSNSRTSTFKLHTRPEEEIKERKIDVLDIFNKAVDRNFKLLKEQASYLRKKGWLYRGYYRGCVEILLNDIREIQCDKKCDIIITSPPYGDNATTVPYGQHSYLPLQWIDFADVHPFATDDYLASTHEIDSRSLGGSKRIDKSIHESLCNQSPTLAHFLTLLSNQPADRTKRVLAFFRDLDSCVEPILKMLHPGGLMIWILGNRKVGGSIVPLDKILTEFLLKQNAYQIIEIRRKISGKRMAPKNNIAETMSTETVLLFRKSM